MALYSLFKRVVSVKFVVVAALALIAAFASCGQQAPERPASREALMARFPERAGEVVGAGTGFTETEEGFVAKPRAKEAGFHPAAPPLEVAMPLRGEQGVRFRDSSGFSMTVREIDASGEGAREENAIAYERPGGRSYWTCQGGDRCEEWLHVDREGAASGEPLAVWEVEGATLRQDGAAVNVIDGSGRTRMRVTAPRAYAQEGRAVEARLSGSGARLELFVEAADGAVLVDPVWESAGSMSQARSGHTATLLPNGKVLVAGGYATGIGWLASAELYDPATKSWSSAGSMSNARSLHTATLLPNGKVLVAGGSNGVSSLLASAELYDPATNSWSSAGSMSNARYWHTATLLPNGKVLVAGGFNNVGDSLASAELYDPGTMSWLSVGSMSTARTWHTATLLPNGNVLVVGGFAAGYGVFASAELYDPGTESWASAGSMGTSRRFHTATLLPNGKLLVAGGSGADGLASAELYDPVTKIWLPTGSLSTVRWRHTATLLPDGQVLFVGGNSPGNNWLASAELYDVATNNWLPAGSMSAPRAEHTATLLPNGQVLIVGVTQVAVDAGPELYGPGASSWVPLASMSVGLTGLAATLLPNGQLLVTGFLFNNPLANAELYDPVTSSWLFADSMSTSRFRHTATLLPNGQVLVAGGTKDEFGFPVRFASGEIYDPATDSWFPVGSMGAARSHHTATLLPNGQVLVAGGLQSSGVALASAELYDPATGSWLPTGSMSAARTNHTATLLPNGQVLVAGGSAGLSSNYPALASAELYDPATGSWLQAGSMSELRTDHTATLLPNGQVLVAGGDQPIPGGAPTVLASAELYDPGTDSWLMAGSMSEPHMFFTATLLPNGKVLVAGGRDYYGGNIATAEQYDPATKSWLPVPSMLMDRREHTATLLPSGSVLVAGGHGASAELYAPERYWGPGGSMNVGRAHLTATLLADNNVLVVGGLGQLGYTASAERYNPASKTWTPLCPALNPPSSCAMGEARAYHTATRLGDDDVLIAGGVGDNGYLTSVERFNPVSNQWSPTGSMANARAYHTAVKLADNRVLVAGGWGLTGARKDTELYDPVMGTWSLGGSMSKTRWGHTVTLLPSNDVLIVGGWGTNVLLNDAEIFNPTSGQWSSILGTMSFRRHGHTATLITNGPESGKVLIAGGNSENGLPLVAEIFDPTSKTFSTRAPMHHGRSGHLAVQLENGQVLVAGGTDASGPVQTAEVYDPSKDEWLLVRSLRTPRSDPAGLLLDDGTVLAVGGIGVGAIPLATSELFELSSTGSLCDQAANCTSGFCVDGVCCESACDAGPCDVCSVRTDVTPLGGQTPGVCKLLTGPACNDGDACTQNDECNIGVCTGTNPVVCVTPDQCHNPGVCNSATGQCSSATAKDDGAPCDDANLCTTNSCQAGQCVLMSQTVCPPSDPCHEAVLCEFATGQCPNPPPKADGFPCNDGDACTKVDACQAGACVGGNVTQCPLPDQCHTPVLCDAVTGVCPPLPAKPDGTFCDDADPCTQTDVCLSGACTGTNLIQCPAPDQCHQPVSCDPATGACPALPAKPEGTFCNDGDACTQTDVCLSGTCTGTDRVLCPAPDACHELVLCDTLTGVCPPQSPKPKGTECPDTNDCTSNERCDGSGVCQMDERACDCQECAPYRCFGRDRQCLVKCSSVDDCAPGFVCDRDSRCVAPPPPASSINTTGCAFAPRDLGGRSPWRIEILALLLAARIARSRRASRATLR